jgi:hypothetical protein
VIALLALSAAALVSGLTTLYVTRTKRPHASAGAGSA